MGINSERTTGAREPQCRVRLFETESKSQPARSARGRRGATVSLASRIHGRCGSASSSSLCKFGPNTSQTQHLSPQMSDVEAESRCK